MWYDVFTTMPMLSCQRSHRIKSGAVLQQLAHVNFEVLPEGGTETGRSGRKRRIIMTNTVSTDARQNHQVAAGWV